MNYIHSILLGLLILNSVSSTELHDNLITQTLLYQILRLMQNITVMSQWASWHLKSLATRLFIQLLVWASIKQDIKSCITGPLWRKSMTDGFPSQRASNTECGSISSWLLHHQLCHSGLKIDIIFDNLLHHFFQITMNHILTQIIISPMLTYWR